MKYSKAFGGLGVFFVLALIFGGIVSYQAYQVNPYPQLREASLEKFNSCSALTNAFKEAQRKAQSYYMVKGIQDFGLVAPMLAGAAEGAARAAPEYSETNIQVAGVDEADIVKTDGEYIYTLSGVTYRYGESGSKLVIAKAYPSEASEILSETDLEDFYPGEMFIHGDYVLIFGSTSMEIPAHKQLASASEMMIAPYPYYSQLTTVQVWDASDKEDPELIRSVDFEGDYLSSRKIGSHVYFVINSYPKYQVLESGSDEDIIPLYRDRKGEDTEKDVSFSKTCKCADVEYFEPINPERFVTIASISMDDPESEINKEVIVGSGNNIYASLENLYVAEMNYPFWFAVREEGAPTEKTIVHKFSLDDGEISHLGYMEAPGRVLNQFSMDEYDNHFRIATTLGRLMRTGGTTSNNVYVFDEDFDMVGKIDDIAPGESIYSARFMGERGYLVTFKKIDPFFVIDLSDHDNPKILGKLKIPGYSDYLHPYDENHIIGIGKDTEEAEEEAGDFAWYQGVKIALFDVTDVSEPKEMHKVIIGDRGTDSYVLHDHKAFLFDRGKNLLVIPILLAEMSEEQKAGDRSPWEHGDYVYQGAYVYDLTPENGFDLKGRITHYDEDDQTFLKSGYYYRDDQYSVKRSLYIDNILYTISGKKIKLNDLSDLSEIKELVFGG
ncbi:MAG: beta-propeller domain-containing protein [Candidatus Aenigmatarchaeota archaeon]|nr:MAG: beta-propeller domain-containing protein [Candidatus Aenigmarchaeota archaeon]